MEKQSFFSYLKVLLKTHIAFTTVLAVYLAFCIGAGTALLVTGVTGTGVRSFAFMLFVPAILVLERLLRVELPPAITALALFIAVGSILGSGFNVYTYVPCFDTVLHGLSGFIFACLGFAVLKLFIGDPKSNRSFFACLVFGFVCSMAIAAVWELFEFTIGYVSGVDVQEDTVISSFQSFLLSGDHNDPVVLEGIDKTIVILEDGSEYVIKGGYLDIGLTDTITDIAVCLGGAAVYFVTITVDWFKGKQRLNRFFIPKVTKEKAEPAEEVPAEVQV